MMMVKVKLLRSLLQASLHQLKWEWRLLSSCPPPWMLMRKLMMLCSFAEACSAAQ